MIVSTIRLFLIFTFCILRFTAMAVEPADIPLPPRTVSEEDVWPYSVILAGAQVPHELSNKMTSREDGPLIPTPDLRGLRVYDKTVAIAWSGANDWVQFLEAVGTFGLLMQSADEVHTFVDNREKPTRGDFPDPKRFGQEMKGYRFGNDYSRAGLQSEKYPIFSKLMKQGAVVRQNADTESLVAVLEPLYREALTGNRIQITWMVSNHGEVVDDKTYEMSGADASRIGEQDLGYIGRLLAPLDVTIVNGTCFGADHVDLILQHMTRHRDELIRQGHEELRQVAAATVTRALMGRPAFGTGAAFEGEIFSHATGSRSLREAYLEAARAELIGHASVSMGSDPYATNLPLSGTDKLGFYLRAYFANKDVKDGKLDNTGFSSSTVASNFIDEGDTRVFRHQFVDETGTYLDLKSFDWDEETDIWRVLLLERQKAIEEAVAELGLPGLEGFNFSDRSKGPEWAKVIGDQLDKREGAGTDGGDYKGSKIEELIKLRGRLNKAASWMAVTRVSGSSDGYGYLDGKVYTDDRTIKIYDGSLYPERKGIPVEYIPDALDQVESEIRELTVGNTAHLWKYAAAIIGRHLIITRRFLEVGKERGRIPDIFATLNAADQLPLLPEVFYAEESGKSIRKTVKQPVRRVPVPRLLQREPETP